MIAPDFLEGCETVLVMRILIRFDDEGGETIHFSRNSRAGFLIVYVQFFKLLAEFGRKRFMLDHRPKAATVRHLRSMYLTASKDMIGFIAISATGTPRQRRPPTDFIPYERPRP